MSSNMLQQQNNQIKPFSLFCSSRAVAKALYSSQSSIYLTSFCVEEPSDAANMFKIIATAAESGLLTHTGAFLSASLTSKNTSSSS